MPKLYEYQAAHHRTIETLRVSSCGQGIYLGVNSIIQMPPGVEDNEQTTSIVIPTTEVEPLMQALAPTVYGEGTVLFGLNGYHIKTLISSLELSMDLIDGEIDQAAKPYDLLEVLKIESDALIERDKQSKKEA